MVCSRSNTTNSEARVLGRYVPSLFQSEIIESEIRQFLPSCCKCERVSVRVPMGIEPMYDNLQWHQDGGGPEGVTRHMVIWASEQPTELRASDGTLFAFNSFDVIWFDNFKAFHRQPENTRASERWFVSVRCSGAMF